VGRPLAQIDRVTKRFVKTGPPAIDAVTASIAAGAITGVVGPDGAGKTTLLRLMAGLLAPDEGALTVCGFDSVREIANARPSIAYMPQHFGLYEDLTVIENLHLYADLRSVDESERGGVFERLLDFTNLAQFTKRRAGKLSGGMKQKLGLACALMGAPQLLLLDEPSVGVDPISRRELWRMILELADQGIGVVWSTAYLDEAERCESVILLSEGKPVYHGPPVDFTHKVEGKVALIRNMPGDKRDVLMRAMEAPEILDGVIQGNTIRLVLNNPMAEDQLRSALSLADAEIEKVPPRFEDAFMASLGGGPKKRSPFTARPVHGAAPDEIVIKADALTKKFGDFTAADQITFSIRRGEVFGLIGPNGAGKSTTFKMLCGLLRPTSGHARISGLDFAAAPSKARARLGYMAQKFSLYGDLTVRQNLEFFAGAYGLSGKRKTAALDQAITTFNFAPYLEAQAARLPLGYKQRLALSCAVLHDPDVLFLDEPTSGVDPRTRREFWTHINAMARRGVTIMVTTHFLDEAEYCDRIALIFRGRVIAEGLPDELKTRSRREGADAPTLEQAFITLVREFDEREAI